MKKFKYIIVGGGMAGDMAVRGIREHDDSGSIAMFTAEEFPPYDRPPLSKGLWISGDSVDDIDRETADLDVTIFLNSEVVGINRQEQQISTRDGQTFQYERLLLATGGNPRRLSNGVPGIIYYRNRRDYETLAKEAANKRKIAVIGGGYIGTEIAASLVARGHEVAMFYPENNLLGRIFPNEVAEFVSSEFTNRGVSLNPRTKVAGITRSDAYTLQLDSGKTFVGDVVIAGLGITPNVELAKQAGLVVSDGIEVNEFMQTSDKNIFAAGDVASIYSPSLKLRRRVEHEQNANRTGKYAGLAMAGSPKSIGDFLPMFYSDAFDLSWEGVGEVSARMDSVIVWEHPFKVGAIYYLNDGILRGAVMWNQWGKLKEIRALIRSGEKFSPDSSSI